MKRRNLRRMVNLLVFLGAMAAFSSCNRGYGCPTNFSLGESVIKVVDSFLSQVILHH